METECRGKMQAMQELDISPDRLSSGLLSSSRAKGVAVLDSCAIGDRTPRRVIGGTDPVHVYRLGPADPMRTLERFEKLLRDDSLATIFTLAYEFGAALNGVDSQRDDAEPDIYAAQYDRLLVHDYAQGRSWQIGPNLDPFVEFFAVVSKPAVNGGGTRPFSSNFSRRQYADAVKEIKNFIRAGDTYQANLTQKLSVELPARRTPASIFLDLRRNHPARFAAYFDREDSTVVSVSPEQFLRVERRGGVRRIVTEPIKGTRPRGPNAEEDQRLRNELVTSVKDRAENTMIVDLMRNDLGRICEFGSVVVEDVCRIEQHPTLFHLVSTVSGTLRPETTFANIITATFPCGSITGAPKIRTMQILNDLEPDPRGLSMGAIGCRIPEGWLGAEEIFEMSVAIRTMVIRDGVARFNVGGGVVIDSDPEAECDESLLKAKALLNAINARSLAAKKA